LKKNITPERRMELVEAKAKLSEEQVREIREIYVPGKRGFSLSALGKKYNVNMNTIWFIVKGITWKHVI
jgi:hypothetical protein